MSADFLIPLYQKHFSNFVSSRSECASTFDTYVASRYIKHIISGSDIITNSDGCNNCYTHFGCSIHYRPWFKRLDIYIVTTDVTNINTYISSITSFIFERLSLPLYANVRLRKSEFTIKEHTNHTSVIDIQKYRHRIKYHLSPAQNTIMKNIFCGYTKTIVE